MSRHEDLTADAARDAQPVIPAAPAPASGEPEAPAKKGGRKRLVLAAVILAALGAGGYEGWQWWSEGRFMVGTDDAYVQADITLISSRVQGYVSALPVDENTHVKAGDVLVRLDDGDYRIALETARSRVATAGRTLERIDAQIEAANAAVAQAAAGRDSALAQQRAADSNLRRVSGLADRNVAAQAQLDTATEGADTAAAGVAQADAAVASARAQVDVLSAQRAEAEGARREMELAVDQAQRNLDMTVLRAPVDGTLANLAVQSGDLVSPGARLAALVPDDGYYIEANFKETQMPELAPGQVVQVTFDAIADRSFEGVVASAAPATGSIFSLLPAENATGNFTKVVQRVPVRIDLPLEAERSGQLRAGLSAVVDVDTRTTPEQAPASPSATETPAAPAVSQDGGPAHVASAD